MRQLLIICAILCNWGLAAQPTFNYIYDNGGRTELSFFSTETGNSGNYLVTTASFGGNLNEFQVLLINSSGSLVDSLNLPTQGHQWYPENIEQLTDSTFIAGGSLVDIITGFGDFFLVKFDHNLDTLWTARYDLYPLLEGTKKIKPLDDGGVFIAGFVYDHTAKDGQNLFFKIDSTGQKEWALIHGDTTRNEEPYDVVQLPDSSYLVLSRRVYPDNDNILLLRISPQGKLIWEKEVFSPLVTIGSVLIPLTDTTFLIAGQGRNNNNPGKPFVECFDIHGNSKWKKFYYNSRGTFWHGDKVNDSTFVFAGAVYGSNQQWDGYVVATNESGDEKWRRIISPYGQADDPSNDYFYGVLATSDGGLLCTGFTGQGPVSNTQDAWIMKLDSTGLCDTATCFPWLVSVPPPPTQEPLQVWPNPASQTLFLRSEEPGQLILTNVSGVQVLSTSVGTGTQTIDISALPAGYYVGTLLQQDGQRKHTSIIITQ